MLDVLSLDELVPADVQACSSFGPAPRFADKTFGQFVPRHLTQARALSETKTFLGDVTSAKPRSWPWQRTAVGGGLYLDGGYGVGKTHLLAAAYTACAVDVQRKAYLSFSDLVYAIGLLGVEAFRERIKGYKLFCIDEFELDDPGNTTLIYWFLSHVLIEGAWIITTSNTLPEVQGQGRFNAPKFRREIQDLASRFTVVTLDGPDYRQREYPTRLLSEPEIAHLEASEAFAKPKVSASWPELFALLRDRHPFRYGHLVEQIDVLYLHEATPIGHPDDALHFVHFIDKFYEFNKSLRMSGNLDLAELFVPSYRDGAFAKKYYRCLSRISELMNGLPVDASTRAAFN